jgi:hypothetical protein
LGRFGNDNPQKIKVKNQDKIDWLWCQSIFLPNMSNLSEIVKGIELGDFLFKPAIMDKTLRQMAAGSLEIETGTQAQLKFGNNSANRSTFEHRKYFYNQNPWCIVFCIFFNYYTLLYSFLYNLQKIYIAIKEKSAFLIFIDTDLIAVFICWEGLVFNCLNKIISCRSNTATG